MLLLAALSIRFTLRLPEGFGDIHHFQQKLDHFNHSDQQTFQQRYAVNEEFYNAKDPKIILYISGENHMYNSTITRSSSFVPMAKEIGCLMATLEHRFYGYSVPLDLTTENLRKYQNTDQALEDLAAFAKFLRNEYCDKVGRSDCPLLIVGGSYAGTLSAFFREKFPHLANYSWSSSPPLNIKNNFSEYDAHVAHVLQNQSQICLDRSVEIVKLVDKIVGNPSSQEYADLRAKMGLKRSTYPISISSLVADLFAGMVQYMTSSTDLQDWCKNMTADDSAARWQSFLDYFVQSYPDPDAGDQLLLTDVSKDSDMVDSRSWSWQVCNEYGWFQTASGLLRSEWVNMSYVELICETIFDGTKVANQDDIRRRYGGVDPKITNVVFTNGIVDPWSAISVDFESTIENGQAHRDHLNRYSFKIVNGSHCSDLNMEKPSDSDDLKTKRKMIVDIVKGWMTNTCASHCKNGDCITGVCVCHEGFRGEFCETKYVSNLVFKEFSCILVFVPTLMMIVIGISAWVLFKKDRDEPEIKTIA